MTARKPTHVDDALDDTLFEAIEDLACPTCGARGWTVRVSTPETGRFSHLACDDCAPRVLAIVRRVHRDAEVYDLPGKAHTQRLPL